MCGDWILILTLEAEICLVKGLLVSFLFLNKKGEPLVINVLNNLQPIEQERQVST